MISDSFNDISGPLPTSDNQDVPEIVPSFPDPFEQTINYGFAKPQECEIQNIKDTEHDAADICDFENIHRHHEEHHTD